MDLYKKIADEFNVERNAVKAVALPAMYRYRPAWETVEQSQIESEIREQVQLAIQLGAIVPKTKESNG